MSPPARRDAVMWAVWVLGWALLGFAIGTAISCSGPSPVIPMDPFLVREPDPPQEESGFEALWEIPEAPSESVPDIPVVSAPILTPEPFKTISEERLEELIDEVFAEARDEGRDSGLVEVQKHGAEIETVTSTLEILIVLMAGSIALTITLCGVIVYRDMNQKSTS